MNKIKISNTGIHQPLEWSQCNTLENARPQKAVLVLPTDTRPDTTDDHQYMSDQEEMAFTPDPSSWYDQNARYTDTAQVISSQQCGCCECDFLIVCDGDGIRS
jgi:hypothetical protein